MMHGEWEIAAMEPCRLPQKVATGFTEAFDGMRGAPIYTCIILWITNCIRSKSCNYLQTSIRNKRACRTYCKSSII